MSRLTPEELREIRRLHIQASRRVDGMFAGDYRSAVRGQGMEFEEVRGYVPGDDVRHIDWNVTARTGHPFIKVFREERQAEVALVVDVSGSTFVGTGGRDGETDRRRQMARVAGGLAYAAHRNRDRISLVTFTDRIEAHLPARQAKGHIWAVLKQVYEGAPSSRGTDLNLALQHVGRTHRRRSVIIVVSDFLDRGDWDRTLAVLARKHQVYAICVTDPLDEALPFKGLVRVHDAETGRMQLVDARSLRQAATPGRRVERIKKTGALPIVLSTQDDPFRVLRRAFQAKAGRR